MKAENEPTKPYIGFFVAPGDAIPIQHGNILLFVPEPGNVGRMIPVIFDKVTVDGLHFVCACGRAGCDRRLTYKLKVTGQHHFGMVGQGRKG